MAINSKKRKFLATSLTATMVAAAVAPVAGFAAEAQKDFPDLQGFDWAKDAIEYLVGKNVIDGNTDGTYNPSGELTRAQAAKILATELNLNIDDNAEADFADTKGHWASKYVAAITSQTTDVINGYKGNFNPEDSITRQEMAKMVVNAYGLKLDENADVSFTDNNDWGAEQVAILASLGVVEGKGAGKFAPNENVNRAEAAVFVHRTVVEDVRVPVAQKEVEELAVESVMAINANQVLVSFNQAIEKESAENLSNYLLEGKILTNGSSSTVNVNLGTVGTFTQTPKATLQADGKSVLITIDTVADSTTQVLEGQVKQKLTIENVKTITGEELTKVMKEFTHIDTTVPTVESVTTEGNRVVVVKFSEFVITDTATKPANYQIDGVSLTAYGAGTGVYNAETNEVRFTLSSALADKTYEFKYSVNNAILDAAGFKVVEAVTNLPISADTTIAKVTAVEVVKPSNGSNYILVKFSKPLAATSNYITGSPVQVDGSAYGTSVENGALKITNVAVTTNGAHAINILNNATNYLVDAYGIKVDAGAITYTVEADTVKPAVTSVKVLNGNKQIEVKYSEKVEAITAQNRLNYTIKNDKGSEQTIQSASYKTGSQDTVVLTLSKALNAGTFTIEAKNVKDQASPANTMDAYTGSLVVVDTVKPTVSNVEFAGTNVYVTFSEDMNTATITDKANYLFDNKALPSDAKVTAISNTVAKIEFATGTAVAGKKFAVSTNVTDLAGNPLSGFGYETTIANAFTIKSLDVDVTSGSINKIDRVSKYTVAVTLNKALELLDAAEFEYSVDNGTTWIPFTQQNASFVTTDGKSKITFTFDENAEGNASDHTVKQILHNVTDNTNILVKTNVTGTSKTKATDGSTLAGAVLDTSGIAVNDKVAPAIELTSSWNVSTPAYNVVAQDTDANGKVDTLDITFTEALKPGSVSKDDFAVTGLVVDDVAVNSKVVTLTLQEGSVSDISDIIGVSLVGDIEDAAGNVLKADTSKTYSVNSTVASTNLALINQEASTSWSTVDENTFARAGISGVTAANLSDVEITVAAAYATKTSDLTRTEVQVAVNDTLAVLAEVAKYETTANIAKGVATGSVTATVVALKAGKIADANVTVVPTAANASDGISAATHLAINSGEVEYTQYATGSVVTEKVTIKFTKGEATKDLVVDVAITSQD